MLSVPEFLGLEEDLGGRWRLPVTARLTNGGSGSLFGGVGLAAGVVALERLFRRPVVWATGQYLAKVGPPATLDLGSEVVAAGRFTAQGQVRGNDAGRPIITVLGAGGRRPPFEPRVFAMPPSVRGPDDCELIRHEFEESSIHEHVELRAAEGMFGFTGQGIPTTDGHAAIWIRLPGVTCDRPALALLGDYMASAVGNAVGRMAHCTSLDNSIRFLTAASSADWPDWVLCDSQVHYVGNGFAHGTCILWSEEGHAMAVASQSMAVIFP